MLSFLRLILYTGLVLFLTTNICAQSVEVGDYSEFSTSSAIQLKNRVLIEKYTTQEYFITQDFKTLNKIDYPSSEVYEMHFVYNEELYILVKDEELSNQHYIIKLNIDNKFDTLVSATLDSWSFIRFIASSEKEAYFRTDKRFLRFYKSDSSLAHINLPVESVDNIHLTDSGTYFYGDHVYWLAGSSITPIKGNFDFSQYHDITFIPHFSRFGGALFTFRDTLTNGLKAGFCSLDTVIGFYNLPWSHTNYKMHSYWPFGVTSGSYQYYGEQVHYNFKTDFLPCFGMLETPYSSFEYVYDWYRFDNSSQSFYSLNASSFVGISSSFLHLFNLKSGLVAFTHNKNAGPELTNISKNGVTLVKDIFPGLASFIDKPSSHNLKYRQSKTELFFAADHPYYNHVLCKSDGTISGTGILSRIPNSVSSKIANIFDLGENIFFSSKGIVYKIEKDQPFLQDTPSWIDTNTWNRSVYNRLYYQSSSGSYLVPPATQFKNGKVLVHTNPIRTNRFYIPELGVVNINHGIADLPVQTAIFDTSGYLLKSFITSSSKYSSPIVKTSFRGDSAIAVAYEHNKISYSGFDTIETNTNEYLVISYDWDENEEWRAAMSSNVKLNNLQFDNDGNLYLVGYYSNGFMEAGALSISSLYNVQYFIAKINSHGSFSWLKNLSMDDFHSLSNLSKIIVDEAGSSIFILLSEGSPNVSSSCRYRKWITKICHVNRNNGNIAWTSLIKTTDLSVFYNLTTTEVGEIVISGTFRGEVLKNGKPIAYAEGDSECPAGAALIFLDKNTGKMKRVRTRSNGEYNSVNSGVNGYYTVFIGSEIGSNAAFLEVEQYDNSSRVISSYKCPTNRNYSGYKYFSIIPEINSANDWLLFSASLDGTVISDTLYKGGQSSGNNAGDLLLMRRSGKIFRDFKILNSSNWASNEIVVYPNPTLNSEVFIGSLQEEVNFNSYRIIELNGQEIVSESIKQMNWPIHIRLPSHLNGIYILQLVGQDTFKNFKIICGGRD